MHHMTSKAKAHSEDQNGIHHGYRSGLEVKIAEGLQEIGVPFQYEERKFGFTEPAKRRTYTPDFLITTKSGKLLIIEAKGRFRTADRQRHLHFRASNPELPPVRFIFSNPRSRISKDSKTTYGMWCTKNDFMFVKFDPAQVIPQEWLDE